MSFQLGAFFPTRDMPADHLAIRDWAQAAEALGFDFLEVSDHVLGTTHVTFYTSGQGVGAVPQQIEAMRQFHAAVR